jgi:hypothetical protein
MSIPLSLSRGLEVATSQWTYIHLASNQLEGKILYFQVTKGKIWDHNRPPGLILNRNDGDDDENEEDMTKVKVMKRKFILTNKVSKSMDSA